MRKTKDLLIITGIYLLAYVVGYLSVLNIDNIMLKLFLFDVIATILCYAFSVIKANSSVYDAYWSLTPMFMSFWLFISLKSFGLFEIIFLILFNIWSLRLTLNWVSVFNDFSYEDWRYKKFRDETHPALWPLVNFWGIHMMPTLVVFAGMLPLFEIAKGKVGFLSVPGFIIILVGILEEFFADRQMHAFLLDNTQRKVCNYGLWKYSRHPNYLGEITVWLGVYLSMLPYALDKWFYGIGFFSILLLFNFVSIPLMEKRQLLRRADYAEYQKATSRLLILPSKL